MEEIELRKRIMQLKDNICHKTYKYFTKKDVLDEIKEVFPEYLKRRH